MLDKIRDKCKSVAVCIGASLLIGLGSYVMAEKPKELTTQEINYYMSLFNVQSILGYTKHVKDIQIGFDNLETALETLKTETFGAEQDGVMWFEYDSNTLLVKQGTGYDAIMRESVIFLEFDKQYSDDIKLISIGLDYDTKDEEERLRRTLNKYFSSWGMQGFDNPVLRNTPSIHMFSRYDVLNEETPENNDGRIKHVDTLFGGPTDNKVLVRWNDAMGPYWIEPNITEINGEFTYRFKNTDNVTKQEY